MKTTNYKRQSNENRTSATNWQWNLFYLKVIVRSVNIFIPLGDETINSSLVERDGSLMDPQLTHYCTSSSELTRIFSSVIRRFSRIRPSIRANTSGVMARWAYPGHKSSCNDVFPSRNLFCPSGSLVRDIQCSP